MCGGAAYGTVCPSAYGKANGTSERRLSKEDFQKAVTRGPIKEVVYIPLSIDD